MFHVQKKNLINKKKMVLIYADTIELGTLESEYNDYKLNGYNYT